MRAKDIISCCIAIIAATGAISIQAENADKEHIWMIKKPGNIYWKAPETDNTDTPVAEDSKALPADKTDIQSSAPASADTASRSIYKIDKTPVPAAAPPEIKPITPIPPPPTGPYQSASHLPDNAASAFYLPGYRSYPGNYYRPGYNYNRQYYDRHNRYREQRYPDNWRRPYQYDRQRSRDNMRYSPSDRGRMSRD